MIIKRSEGFELEKDLKNQPTDLFNRSEVTINENGIEREFHVLYLRYFDEILAELTPFQENPVLQVNGESIYLKDIVALCTLLTNRDLATSKRIYVHDEKDFKKLFHNLDLNRLGNFIEEIKTRGEATI